MNRPFLAILIAIISLLGSGCGYHNPYLASGTHPITVQRSMWVNHTTEMGLDNTLLQSQDDWLRKSPLIRLTESAEGADFILSGSIDRVSYPEVSFGAYREGIEGRADLTVSFTLTDHKSGQVVWRQQGVSRQQTFAMSQDNITLQANRKAALAKIADHFAEDIYLHLITHTMRPL